MDLGVVWSVNIPSPMNVIWFYRPAPMEGWQISGLRYRHVAHSSWSIGKLLCGVMYALNTLGLNYMRSKTYGFGVQRIEDKVFWPILVDNVLMKTPLCRGKLGNIFIMQYFWFHYFFLLKFWQSNECLIFFPRGLENFPEQGEWQKSFEVEERRSKELTREVCTEQ